MIYMLYNFFTKNLISEQTSAKNFADCHFHLIVKQKVPIGLTQTVLLHNCIVDFPAKITG